jgi:methionyl-tRNA formyltransferase
VKIVILTNRDLASQLALTYLVRDLHKHQLAIFISENVGNADAYPDALKQLAMFERQAMTSLDLNFDQLAEIAGCKLQGFSDLDNRVNSAEGVARIRDLAPDLIISVRFGLIIDQPVISIPQNGVINLHSGVLPEYRGVMATFRAMLNGDSDIGSTLHYITDRGVDTGDILSIETRPLNPKYSYLLNVLRLYPQGCKQILGAVSAINNTQPLINRPQQGDAKYYSFPNSRDIEQFRRLGFRLYDPDELQLIKDLQP